MRLLLATHNMGKIMEMSAILASMGVEILSPETLGITVEVEETGETFAQNARLKARAIFALAPEGVGVVADDSGLCVDALDGAPGIYSARYGGIGDTEARNAYLLGNISHVEPSKRTAKFVCAVACILPDGSEIEVSGQCLGVLNDAPVGEGGFGYDPLFIPEGYHLTLAQLSPEEKNRISHRAQALEKLKNALIKSGRVE